jgi:hypothetical protein
MLYPCHTLPNRYDMDLADRQDRHRTSGGKSHEEVNANASDAGEEDTQKQTRKTSLEKRTEREDIEDERRRLIRARN